MLFALWHTLLGFLPTLTSYLSGFTMMAAVCFIMLIGLVVALGAVGVHLSMGPIVNSALNGFGYIVDRMIRAIGWVVRGILRSIPRIFGEVRQFATNAGASANLATVIAVITTGVLIAIII